MGLGLVSRKLEIDISFAFHCNLCMFPQMWCCSASMLWFPFIGCPPATVRYNMIGHDLEELSMLLALCEGNPPMTGGFPSQRSSNMGFEVFVDVSLNKLLKKTVELLVISYGMMLIWHHCNGRNNWFVKSAEVVLLSVGSVVWWPDWTKDTHHISGKKKNMVWFLEWLEYEMTGNDEKMEQSFGECFFVSFITKHNKAIQNGWPVALAARQMISQAEVWLQWYPHTHTHIYIYIYGKCLN